MTNKISRILDMKSNPPFYQNLEKLMWHQHSYLIGDPFSSSRRSGRVVGIAEELPEVEDQEAEDQLDE